MKTARSLLMALAIGCLALSVTTGGLTGCASSQVAPGSEAFVVESEKDLRSAFYVVDGFLEWELANRPQAGKDVTAVADDLRAHFPGYLKSAEEVLRTYKANRTADNKAALGTWVATLNAAMIQSLKYLPQATANAAYAKAGNPSK